MNQINTKFTKRIEAEKFGHVGRGAVWHASMS